MTESSSSSSSSSSRRTSSFRRLPTSSFSTTSALQSFLLLLTIATACAQHDTTSSSSTTATATATTLVDVPTNRLRGSSSQSSSSSSSSSSSGILFSSSDAEATSLRKRYWVQYKDWKGRQSIHNCATAVIHDHNVVGQTIVAASQKKDSPLLLQHHYERRKETTSGNLNSHMIIEATEECYHRLLINEDIGSIEEDRAIFAFQDFDNGLDSSSQHETTYAIDPDDEDQQRQLAETTPWGIEAIQADQIEPGPYGVTICIVDSGVAANHPDLPTSQISGVDRADRPRWNWNIDRAGHGTHVAGIVAAQSNNARGVRGVISTSSSSSSPSSIGGIRLFSVRALSDDREGYESDIWMGVQQCINAGADVINLSLGSPVQSAFAGNLYRQAVEEFGVVLVAAAGNSGDSATYYPASHPSVISVAAASDTGDRLSSSVFNSQIELAGPGVNILSTSTAFHSVQTSTFGYPAELVTGTPDLARTGPLAKCDYDDKECDDVQSGGICLISATDADTNGDGTSLQEVLDGCKEGGGIGAILYSEAGGRNAINRMYTQGETIPAVVISRGSALELIDQMRDNFVVTIGDQGNDSEEYTYVLKSGTSMAAPHVTASIALLKSHFDNCKPSQLRFAMELKATGGGKCNENVGYGIIQVKDTFDWLAEKGGCGGWDVPSSISFNGCENLDEGSIINIASDIEEEQNNAATSEVTTDNGDGATTTDEDATDGADGDVDADEDGKTADEDQAEITNWDFLFVGLRGRQ
mmetsp:Transcript_31564/g.76516  ORF Transcript_31564/g.76516 Transcript_31564/m.76516 type:complete len:755 (-) Transcript_31564:2288-4552(-)